jgi:type IV fimbrial biogenesis protein FimU
MRFRIPQSRSEASSNRPGFTMVEMVIVITIAGIIAAFAIPSFSNTQRNRNAQNARDSFVWLGAKARSRAIEMGTTWLLEISPATERAWIVKRNPTVASDTLEIVNYVTKYASTISTASNNVITLCFNSRGFAWSCSGNSPGSNVDITFTHAQRTAVARVKPLGQMQRL